MISDPVKLYCPVLKYREAILRNRYSITEMAIFNLSLINLKIKGVSDSMYNHN